MGTNIRIVIGDGDEGQAVCLCGCTFEWNVPRGLNILYKTNGKGADILICCPRCLLNSTIKK